MEKNNTGVTHVMPTQTGVVTQAPLREPGQTHVVPVSQTSYKFQLFWGEAMFENVLRIIVMVSQPVRQIRSSRHIAYV